MRASQVVQWIKNLPAMWETQERQVWSLSQKDTLEEGMAIHSSILAWRIPWTEEPGRLQSRGLQRIGHHWSTTHTHMCVHTHAHTHTPTHTHTHTHTSACAPNMLLASCFIKFHSVHLDMFYTLIWWAVYIFLSHLPWCPFPALISVLAPTPTVFSSLA